MTTVEFNFITPPEAPIFEPTAEEFKDPLGYIAKIRPIAEKTGICKIKPPPDWQPPFVVDVDNFKFTPRVQRLNELEATTRVKLNFLDQIAKFWELQGSSLKIPNVERKVLDLFSLHRIVQDEGGVEFVSRERKWSKVGSRMGFPYGKGVGATLRLHYERILYPFDIFNSGKAFKEINLKGDQEEFEKKDKDYIPHGIPSRQAIKPPSERYARRSVRHKECEDDEQSMDNDDKEVDLTSNSELKKLQFYGAGPKMPGYSVKDEEVIKKMLASKLIGKDKKFKTSSVDHIICHTCCGGDEEASMLLCDGCDDSYHTFCLIPPLLDIPKGDWRCPRCVAEEVSKPHEAFGFEQAQKEYTLQEFGEMADQFKADYFNMPVHLVPNSLVEKEFWRIVNAVDEDVTVEYGADLHTIDHGSGFPTKGSKNILPEDEEYLNSGWNLNNLPVLDGSVFRHINADISGMKIPWMYVGMCFATFCWHNEDHWSYSINYLHWGEPKTWYGVPGSKAEVFENSMKSAAPELFQSQPDLLHQLVTIMNPNMLMEAGVPIYKINQHAGEFVITFPRSYHAGFNQGYNFAEAVNFAPADWLPIGRVCITHYSMLHRFCVFSHDELVCKMAADPERLDISLAASTYQDMLRMVQMERDFRKELLEWGVNEAEREAFELLPDDERQCDYCKTTCFLSAVTCSCSSNKLVCINHKNKLCQCAPSKHCLRYRYTLDELPVMLHRLKNRAESFDNWAFKVKTALDENEETKLELSDLKELVQEADEKRFPKSELLTHLSTAVNEAEKCMAVAQQLLGRKVRTRNRGSDKSGSSSFGRLTQEDLELFCQQICGLSCQVKEAVLIKDLLDRVVSFKSDAEIILNEESPEIKRLEKLLDAGYGLDIDLPELPQLKQKVEQTRWLDEVRSCVMGPADVDLDTIRKLLDSGVNLPPHPLVEKSMAEMQEMLTIGEQWEEKAKICLQSKPPQPLNSLELIAQKTNDVPVFLPNVLTIRDAIRKTKEWTSRINAIHNGEHYPYLDLLENLVLKGRPIPVKLDDLPLIEAQVGAAKSWRERTSRTFLKKNSSYTLVQVLSPRQDVGIYNLNKNKKRKPKDNPLDKEKESYANWDLNFEEAKDPATIVATFKQSELDEIEAMRNLRIRNLRKRAEDDPDAHYCLCRMGLTNYMLQCQLCKDWFHANCVPLPKSPTFKKQQQQLQQGNSMSSSSISNPSSGCGPSTAALTAHLSKELKFLCPMCLRSRRPRLETILSLLVSLQKLPVRLPEGDALQCLTERAMSWQDRARQALATEELAAALAKLSILSQRMVEQAAREKTEKIISTELMKAANNPDLQSHLQNVMKPSGTASSMSGVGHTSGLIGSGFLSKNKGNEMMGNRTLGGSLIRTKPPSPLLGSMTEDMVPAVAAEQEVALSDPLMMEVETTVESFSAANLSIGSSFMSNLVVEDGTRASSTDGDGQGGNYNNMEHAYSSASKTALAHMNIVAPRKHPRKSPLVPRQLDSPVLELSNVAKAQLEELMMEGDLLEVSLDETQHIWRILQATKPIREMPFLMGFPDGPPTGSRSVDYKLKEKKKNKKRPMDEPKMIGKGKDMIKPSTKMIMGIMDAEKPKKKMKTLRDLQQDLSHDLGQDLKDSIQKDSRENMSSASSTTSNSSSSSSSTSSSSSSSSEGLGVPTNMGASIGGPVLTAAAVAAAQAAVSMKKPLKVKIDGSKVRRKSLGDKKSGMGQCGLGPGGHPSQQAVRMMKDKMNKILEKRKMVKKSKGPGAPNSKRKMMGKDSDDGDESEMCSAGRCLRPIGDAVNWVQCDGGCDLWFHLVCVGLVMNDIHENEDYICPCCSSKKPGLGSLMSLSESSAPFKLEMLNEEIVCTTEDSQEAAEVTSVDLHIDVDSVLQVTTDDSSQEEGKNRVTANLMSALNAEHYTVPSLSPSSSIADNQKSVTMDLHPPLEVAKEFNGISHSKL